MAIQNFLSGGYYGKLGATVGQRWKNKRTIRAYVVPANPRTEKQQANRGLFGNAVQWAQLALQMNYKVTLFQSENMTAWNYRMKTARLLMEAGKTNFDLIPLYPTSFVVPYLITECEIERVESDTSVLFNLTGTLPSENRQLSVVFDIYSSTGQYESTELFSGEITADAPNVMRVTMDDPWRINNKCIVRIVSNDDVDSTTDMIASNQLAVSGVPIIIQDFDTTIRSVVTEDGALTITFNQAHQEGHNTYVMATINCVVNGERKNLESSSGTLINNAGYFAIVFDNIYDVDNYRPAFPAGSGMSFSKLDSLGSEYEFIAEDVVLEYSDTDLTRNIDFEVVSVERDNLEFTIKLANVVPSANTTEIDMYAYCVYVGRFVTRPFVKFAVNNNEIKITDEASTPQEILAFPSGSTIRFSGYYEVEGVTYTIANTGYQSISNSDLARGLQITPSGISRSGTRFTVTTTEPMPSGITGFFSGSLTGVSAGQITTDTGAGWSVSDNSLSKTISALRSQLIMAFPVGSTVSYSGYITGNGVRYTVSDTSEKPISNSDTVRQMEVMNITEGEFGYTYSTRQILYVPEGYTTSLTANLVTNELFGENASTVPVTITVGTYGQMVLNMGEQGKPAPALGRCTWQIPNATFVVNGVTYTWSMSDPLEFTNTYTTWGYAFDASGFEVYASGNEFQITVEYLLDSVMMMFVNDYFVEDGTKAILTANTSQGSIRIPLNVYVSISNEGGIQFLFEDESGVFNFDELAPFNITLNDGQTATANWQFTLDNGWSFTLPALNQQCLPPI